MSPLIRVSFCLCLLACAAVRSAHGQFGGLCPVGASTQLDKCLTSLENLASLSAVLPSHCMEMQEALKCTRTVVMACMHSDAGILKVLGLHQPVPDLLTSTPLSMCFQIRTRL